MKRYKIVLEGKKYNIIYLVNDVEISKEFYGYSLDEPIENPKPEYIKHPDSL